MARAALALLSTENLLHNVAMLRKRVFPAKIVAVVKANAYGHGIRSVGLRIASCVDLLGVASIEEALALRKVGVSAPILLMEGIFDPQELHVAAAEDFQIVIHEHAQVEWLGQYDSTSSKKLYKPLGLWIKVDTGMGRLGFPPDQVPALYRRLLAHSFVHSSIGVISHLACSDLLSHPMNGQQIQAFEALLRQLPANTHPLSLCASGGIVHFPHCFYDYVRPGLLLYGVSPIAGTMARDFGLRPVMTLQSSIIAIHQLTQGDTIGYGARYACALDTTVGVLAMGYGDGYPFSARDGTPILIHDMFCPLIGRVSMDMITVDLTHCPRARIGDPAILWGEGLPLEQIAKYTDEIPHTLVTGVQHRVKFVWQ